MLRRVLGLALVALLTLAIGVHAQESASSGITGQVLDSSKAGLPGATITVINTGTNAQRVTQSDAEGRFSVPNLPPATYLLKVALSGFQAAESGLTLRMVKSRVRRSPGDRGGNHYRDRHVATVAVDQRVRLPDDLAEAD
jgi:hypothetical protein